MFSDRILRNALIASIICHVFLFYNWPPLRSLSVFKTPPDFEITYYCPEPPPIFSELIDEQQKKIRPILPAARENHPTALKKKSLNKPTFDLKDSDKPDMKTLEVERSEPARETLSDQAVLISYQERDLSKEPNHLDYYNAVRAKIYKVANSNKPHYFAEGEVGLTFTLARDGSLLNTAVTRKDSSANPVLRHQALTSIKKAAPFPPFHRSMQEDQLTLRLTISFEK